MPVLLGGAVDAPPTPSANLNLSDPATWLAILSIVQAVVLNAWPHLDLAPFVPAMSVLAAAIVPAVVLFSKHHYAAGIARAAGAAAAAGAALPAGSSPDLQAVAAAIEQVNAQVRAMIAGGTAQAPAEAPAGPILPTTSPPVAPPGA